MLHVEPAPRYRMTSAPLVQAVAQVNFPIVPKLQNLDGVAPLQERLADAYPYLNQQVVQELTIGPAGPAGTPQATTLFVFTGEEGWTFQVSVGTATLSVDGAHYRGVDDFRRRLDHVWAALREATGVARCDRLGVRYVDIVELDDEADWAGWFQPEIVGLCNPRLSGGVLQSSLTETRLQAEPTAPVEESSGQVEGVIRYGLVPQGSLMQGMPPRAIARPSFIFDMDIFVAAPEPFDPPRLAQQFSDLHAQLEKVFHWAVTDDGRAHFGYELLDD